MSIPSFVISLRYLSFYCFLHPKIVAFGQCVEVDGRNSQSELIEKLHDVFFVSFLGSVVTQRIFFLKILIERWSCELSFGHFKGIDLTHTKRHWFENAHGTPTTKKHSQRKLGIDLRCVGARAFLQDRSRGFVKVQSSPGFGISRTFVPHRSSPAWEGLGWGERWWMQLRKLEVGSQGVDVF